MSGGDDDEVGYRKPPKWTRFKPGVSGNARGRPRRDRSMEAMMNRELEQVIVIKEGGRELRLTKREAFYKQIVNRAISGDPKAMQAVLAHEKGFKPVPTFKATEADDAELQKMLAFLAPGADDDQG